MSDFLKKFLLEDPRRFNPTGRYVALGAFGKHPGWDDHVEDLGLETESLNLAKTVLYVNGIGGQIDAGAWEKLEGPQQLPGFKHLLVWQRSGQILIGRMWSSSDGKGRKRYPMVVCLHFMGVTLGWALKQALPVLAELEQACVGTTSAEDVRAVLGRKRAALREALQSTDGRGEYAPVSPEALYRILNPAGNPRSESFLRVLYQIQSQLGGFAPGTFNVRASPDSVRVQQIRVPLSADSPEQALLFWTRFFLIHVDASVPLLLALPIQADWIDVTVGEPESHEMFCLRATPKAVPMASEVPYKLEDDFRAKATGFLSGFQRGETTLPDLRSAATPVSEAPAPAKGGWLKWLGVGAVLILGVIAAFFLLPQGDKEPSPPNATAVKSNVAISSSNTAAAAHAPTAAETAQLAEEKKKSDSLAAAMRQKAETEAAEKEKERQATEAAEKEKERQLAEAAAKEKEQQLADAAAKVKERQEAEALQLVAEQQAALQKASEEQKVVAATAAESKLPQPAAVTVQTSSEPATNGVLPSPAGAANPGAGQTTGLMTNGIGMVLVLLPSGLWVGKYEVTQGEYRQVMKANPSNSKWLNDRQPVEQVTWNEAVEFTRKLTELEHRSLSSSKAYSLPTEKQWKEFVADLKFEDLPAGSALRKEPSLVGQSGPANKYGLFDVLGNLWEWCLDDAPGDQKVLKGGAFNSNNYERTLRRDEKSLSCGFRCVLVSTENR
jgi:formylglycine-generating enzyme required for sulfatase activity